MLTGSYLAWTQAAAALANLAVGNDANKDTIREEGVLFKLVALLEGESPAYVIAM